MSAALSAGRSQILFLSNPLNPHESRARRWERSSRCKSCEQWGQGAGRAYTTLKITIEEQAEAVRLRLDGRVAGPWVSELELTYQRLMPALATKRLILDLREVTFADSGGRQLLAAIYRKTGNSFVADTPITKYLAEQAMHAHNGTDK